MDYLRYTLNLPYGNNQGLVLSKVLGAFLSQRQKFWPDHCAEGQRFTWGWVAGRNSQLN